jgi:hypothetical protein
MACNPKTQALIVDRDAIDPDEGIQELALFYPNGLPVSFGTMVSEIDAEVIAARGTFQTLGARLDAGGSGGGGGTSDHGGLSGLADDDHLQYTPSFTADFVVENTTLGGIPRGIIITGAFAVTMPNTTSASMVGRAWALTNAHENTVTLNAGSSGALFNGSDETFDIRPGRQIQATLIDIPGIGMMWGTGGLLPVPSSGGAIGVDDIVAGTNVTVEKSPDNQQITISASGSGGGGTSDHGALTGLTDDDHLQYAKSLTAAYINSNTTLSGGPGLYIVNNQSTVTLPGTLTSALYGRSYYIRNNDSGSMTILAGSSGAVFQHDNSTSFTLELYKEAKITLVNISGTGNVWVVNNIVPAINSGGALGINDLQFGSGFAVSSPENDIFPLNINFATNAAAHINYTPANAAHWPTQPTTVVEALNLLAGRVSGLEP